MSDDPTRLHRVLERRARELARASHGEEERAAGETIEVVMFQLGGERYALELIHIQEVFTCREVTPLPGTLPFIAGIINVRGRIVSVVDLRPLFDLPRATEQSGLRVIILASSAMEFGILTEAVEGVQRVPMASLLASLPTLTGVRAAFLKGITRERLIILDGAGLLTAPLLVGNYSPPNHESGSRGLAPWQVQDRVLVGFGAKP
ncbi:MAG: purine-binding chemotaxis protein CheW [Magnetococcales bacterium]|nr:purine-binding chemotaxis protein CheW [Magnetococcales bacterium]